MKKASCHCGQLSASCPDEHLLHAECGCIDCQKRTGTPSSFQVWYKARDVELHGEYRVFERDALTGNTPAFKFCPTCGCTVLVEAPMGMAIWEEDIVQIPVGCLSDKDFAAPDVAVWTSGLPSWFDPVPPKEFCDAAQFESLEEIKNLLTALGKL